MTSPTIERDVGFKPGPQFLEVGGVTCFQFVLDSSNIVGPRKATKADKEEHRGAWQTFNEGRLPQLDHDGVNGPGGSLPRADNAVEVSAAGGPEPKRRGRPPKA